MNALHCGNEDLNHRHNQCLSIDSEILLKMSVRKIIFLPKCNLVYKVLSTSGYAICKCVVQMYYIPFNCQHLYAFNYIKMLGVIYSLVVSFFSRSNQGHFTSIRAP